MDALLADIAALMRRLVGQWPAGKLGPMAQAHLDTGGKQLRARLAAAATLALGGSRANAVAWGAACELAHNATLIHDDLQDGDTHRRGQPTTWHRFGMAQAINAGDLLLMLPFVALAEMDAPGDVRALLCRAMALRMSTVIDGQALECDMTAQGMVDATAYDLMIRGKTGALFELPVFGAALSAGQSWQSATACTEAFLPLGVLFQMQDDLLDLYGDKGRQAPGADLREGKISALVVEHLRLHPQESTALLTLLQAPREASSQTDIDAMIQRFADGGAQRAVLARIETSARQAKAQVTEPLAPLLTALIDRVLAPIAHLR